MTDYKLDLQISRPQAKRLAKLPFFALYLGKFGSVAMPVFLLSKVFSALCPHLAEFKPPRLKDQRELNGTPMAPYSTVEKTEDSFIVQFPLFEKIVVVDLLNSLYNFSSAVQNIVILDGKAVLSIYEEFKSSLAKYLKGEQASFLFKKEQIIQFMKTEQAKLSFSCFDYLFLSFDSNVVSAKVQIRISKEEAELLTQLPFVAIREIDIYPIILHWVYSNYQKGPTTAISLSRVASSLSPSLDPKVNDESLALTDEGNIIYLPKKLDKAGDYEAAFIRYCTNSSKKFGLKVNQEENLPSNMPVLIDWKNLKFTYANGFGYLSILDLSQYRKLTPTHIRNVFIRTEFNQTYLGKLLRYADELGMEEKDCQIDGQSIANYFWALLDSSHITNLYVYDMMGDEYFKPVVDFCTKLYQLLVNKAEFFMARYSVITYYETLGLLKAISVYGNSWDDIEKVDFANREPAIYQSIDKNYVPIALPFWQNAPGLMPHQVRVANLLKNDPCFALLPVSAGGGKCLCGDTFVYTDKGLTQLKRVFDGYSDKPAKIQKGFYHLKNPLSVISSDGRFEEVQYLYTCYKDISTLTLNDGTLFKGLAHHRFYTQDGWKKLSELSLNDYILQQPNSEFIKQSFRFKHTRDHKLLALKAYSKKNIYKQELDSLRKTKIPNKMTKSLAFVIGGIVSEGTSNHTFCNKDSDFLAAYKKAFFEVFGIYPKQQVDKGLTNFKVPNLAVKLFFDDILGLDTKSWTRFVPECILSSKKDHWLSFLQSFFEGDGEIVGIERVNSNRGHDGQVRCYSTSNILASQIFEMLKRLGFRPTFMANTKARVRQWVSSFDNEVHKNYVIKLPVADVKKFYNEIGFASSRKNVYLKCHALDDRVSINNQVSNMTTQGWFNQVPAQREVAAFISLLEKHLDKSYFRIPSPKATYPVYVKQAFVDNQLKIVGLKGQNRYQLNQLLTLVNQDSRINKAVKSNRELTNLYNRICYLYNHTWCKVAKIELNVGKEQVYDLSLPSTHAWVANGYLSHNTIISIMDVLKQYSQQKNGPYIILCPNILIGQYVNEISFFTKGRLNAIPLTTSVIIREGLNRLGKIISQAPRNTVVVASYNAVVYNSHQVAYGTNTISRFPVVEFLRCFHFGYAICDESHQLKNVKADRSNAVRTLLADIPFIRLSSGTLAYNRINDLVGQVAIMDPSIFGSKDDFDKQYGDFTERGKLIGLKPDAEIMIDRKIKSQMVIARAQRKEWAALLPKTKTRYHLVDLSPLESNVYNQILELTAETIATNSDIQKSMKKLEQMRQELAKNYDPELEDEIEEKESKLGSRLTPYLQRLERFVVDPLRESALITEFVPDYISAKVQKVIDIVETHINGGFDWQVDPDGTARKVAVPPVEGKVIIFTENIASAESIYRAFTKHSSVAANGLLYKAANKHELLERFNTDPNIRWMVGVETSINTGLNLQTASRIIRVEYPWQPGALEQGNARILRPLLKTKENRDVVYFDWVLCEATIDTLKVSRLMAKAVEIARFEHPGDARYQKIGVSGNPITGHIELKVPMISITLKTIKACMRFTEGQDHGELYDYYDAMRSLHNLEAEDYESYRKNHPEELTEDGKLKTYPLITLPNPQDAKLLTYTPRVENTVLYGIDNTRLDEYINQKADSPEKLDEVAKSLKGKQVFSEYGKSTIYSVRTFYPLASVIPFNKKYRVELPWSSLFLTEEDLNQKMEALTGLQSVSIEDVEPAGALPVGRRVKKEEEAFTINSAQLTIKLSVLLVNGRLGLRFVDKKNAIASSILSQSGFKLVPSYYRAVIKDYQTLHGWLVKMLTSGYKFRAPYDYSKPWRRIRNAMQKNSHYKASLSFSRKLADKYQLTNPIDWDGKALNRHDLLRVQPLISSGVVFATMPDNKIYPTGKEIRRKRGLKWEVGPSGYERYFSSIKELVSCIKELKQQGFTISNTDQIKSALKKYRTM